MYRKCKESIYTGQVYYIRINGRAAVAMIEWHSKGKGAAIRRGGKNRITKLGGL